MSKAQWIADEFFPDEPTFPLPQEVLNQLEAEDLPGDQPESAEQLADILIAEYKPQA